MVPLASRRLLRGFCPIPRVLLASLVALGLGSPPARAAGDAPLGFFPASAAAQARAEKVFLDTPAPDQASRFLRALTEEPHVAGTPQEKVVADYVKARFEEFGLATEVARYEAFLNHPRSVALKLTQPVQEELSLVEPPLPGDKDSGMHGMFPAFHGYGASGHAAGQVVYVNYGTRADFEALGRLGVEVAGRVVLARYGAVFRGLKVKEAQERGATGVLMYSDPADDGYARGEVYPDGPMRPPGAIQRGSVQFLSLGPGDPTTPGYASVAGAKRVPRDRLATIPRIPSLPISYGEAEKILRRLSGPDAPEGFQGGLPLFYRVGPGAAAVSMDVQMDEGFKPIFNVFARIPGADEPERLVIVGNHRDAWTHGAVDPNSGTAVLLEVARGLAAAYKSGWRPRRTILLASWDAEEYGLVGSTEWAEENAELLTRGALAYLNVDAAVTGRDLSIGGVPALRDVVRESAAALAEPRQSGTLLAAWEQRKRREWAREAPVDLGQAQPGFELQLEPLGSGSDYTVFLDHLGIPALDLSFSGRYGVYHSVYDNYRWMATYGDPGFHYHAAAARLLGLITLRLASADVVPLRFAPAGRALREQWDALRRDLRRRARQETALAAFEPDLAPLESALLAFARAAERADDALDALTQAGDAAAAARANALAGTLERAYLSSEGLPRRPWFRHALVAPGTTTGYAAWPLPGLVQAIEDKDRALLRSEVRRVESVLQAATQRLSSLAALTPAGAK